ncbi:ATPase, P-type, K/Mg/Cd/Cu/Zn/Na/Ca/Na/H-transporter [Rubrobacter xylanophilus DSM 9941]|uniref:ATPase, P-type, K/Mg/Cd/Cu/Zn/Na/Ca/Na/H-transporter n=1 Tax=Rubrobacter xylanophilus (strain DSM 9941 / JCM 11954 / NBRC 16129 / PRD-1) TaxID=266117 RepID=Q1ARJ4_RUBXD|nr:cation-transporting P-type ATPase [Rubrobacter xylanophilus]ABG05984.1 ATPase, P-type, K/Mg/Cd/Cu/Zn/Na/Ca/Na/H-transporter [Rubrobacter xylanophilus DSM 9941]
MTEPATSPQGLPFDPEERIDLLLGHLGTRREGLGEREAARRLEQYGRNEIRRREGRGWLRELARQFTHPLALLLWAAAALAAGGGMGALAVAIVAVIVLNALFAFAQELQAERATEALREFLPPLARVRRDGEVAEVPASSLVPGDLLLLSEGDRISADARLISGSVEVDMSPLTGESQPVGRSSARVRPASSPLEAEDLVFSGTLVTAGEAEAVVYATGMSTQLGRIAALTQRVRGEVSPLQVQVNRAARLIALVAVVAGVAFLAFGTLVARLPLADALVFAISLLVANVPEGLLPTITLALAVGVRRMARRRALLKRLTAVETLGSTDVICTDKTGTLTEGRMVVSRFWAGGEELVPEDGREKEVGEPFSALLRTAVRCSNARIERSAEGWERRGDPSESALLAAAAALGEDVERAQEERSERRRRLYHFDARLKRMTTADEEPDGALWYHSKGAPLELLGRCARVRTPEGERPLSAADREAVREAFERYAGSGLRVLGFAEKRAGGMQPEEERDLAEEGLTFLGLAALEDPPRPEVADAVARCHRAGIRIIVVTGDHGLTAGAVARRVGIVRGEPRIVTGAMVDGMKQAELDALLREERELIVARSNPETKLHIVDALRGEGHTVAMTGDGVNDAPALRRADIGVAMGGSGTEVAREAATMVLTDDSFSSIVAAVEEGRVVYDNIRKFVTYIFAHTTPEVVPFLIYALSGGAVPLPLTVMQILAIDLGTETLPALALGREPAEPGIMERPPRPRGRGILDRPMLVRAWLWLGLVEAALVTGGFFYVLLSAGWSPGEAVGPGSPLHASYLAATTMTFAGITACQIGTAFATRTSRASLRQIGVFSNRLLLWGILFEVLFAAAVIYLPPLQRIFGTGALGVRELLVLAAFPLVVWATDELRRAFVRRRAGWPEGPA